MKSVLISIQPKWCEVIASGRKTIEVRKTAPKLQTPFKCLIYCTQHKYNHLYDLREVSNGDLMLSVVQHNKTSLVADGYLNGKVIGEFMCDEIMPIMSFCSESNAITPHELPFICMTDIEVINYLGNGKEGYGWHISDLKIYDKAKEISEFNAPCPHRTETGRDGDCPCSEYDWDFDENTKKIYCTRRITRPPQSWCYVELSEV